ncbi:Sec-independent protein translocase subunit TatA [Cellulomonas bogoriensis]|uniref:Sec-independent protein translocase protein TatA n=1 Tax=Cellulomonas bogoriensis 69B4 = DSM 16987 TaxID=1386082 RepID=A0A0A0BMW9_9CELL|nr:Sec-independent protein translocase subunit TatA [Cellulomonas bogoriensis]KGM09853.1 preprotein translocase subunit TatA [Cellulomonas bogoriensis 69B4 = DSM 16987]
MPANMRGWELIIILVLILLLFGARRLPDLARSVGRSMKIFRAEVKDLRTDEPAPQDSTPSDDPSTDAATTAAPSAGEERRPTDDGDPAR